MQTAKDTSPNRDFTKKLAEKVKVSKQKVKSKSVIKVLMPIR
jgi:hypothetical protein